MLKKFGSLFVVISLLLTVRLISGTGDIEFEHISIEKGLSQVIIRSILQDDRGFIWFATEDGLNRYDGTRFEVFRHERGNPNSISDNFILYLFQDSKGLIWIGTNTGGLDCYDPYREVYRHFRNDENDPKSISSNYIRYIFEDSKKNLWIGTDGGGLCRYEQNSNRFKSWQHTPGSDDSICSDLVLTLAEDSYNNLWVGTDSGLCRYSLPQKKFERYVLPGENSANNYTVNSLLVAFLDGKEYLLTGTDRGFLIIDLADRSVVHYKKRNDGNSLPHDQVNSIVVDNNDNIWIGTEEGLSIFDYSQKSFTNYMHERNNEGSIRNNYIRTLYKDKNDIIWIGTAGGGIDKYNSIKKRFYHLYHDPSIDNTLSDNMIRSVYEDRSETILIGTMGGVLNAFRRDEESPGKFSIVYDNLLNLGSNAITSIIEDKKGTLWIGSWGNGLYEFENYRREFRNARLKEKSPRNTNYRNIPQDPMSLSSNIIQALMEDSYGNLWIGTESGLDLFLREKNQFYHFSHDPYNKQSLSDNRIQSNCIFEDSRGNLWIGTWGGLNKISRKFLNKMELEEIKFEHFKHDPENPYSLSDNRVISIYENLDGRLWIGTYGGGICRLDDYDGTITFRNFSQKDGLSSEVIYGILGDSKGNLWLSTTNGLSMFNPSDGSFRNFTREDGLQSNQFYWGSSCKTRNGELFFGGINGLNYFHPDDLKDNPHVPPVYITGLKLFNKEVIPDGEDEILSASVINTSEIELSYDQNVLTFGYVALDYTIPQKNQYKYMLEGYDSRWINAGNVQSATYTLTEPGDYVFRVIASNNDGLWNEKGASLHIVLYPPFWKNWWFILGVLFLAGLGIVYFIIAYVKQLLAVERLRSKLAADLHDSIGASLTEISILSEVIRTKIPQDNKDVRNILKQISAKSRLLVDEMSDIVWLVNPKRDSIYDLILRLEDAYSEMLSFKGISFSSSNLKSLEKISLAMEQRQNLFLIFKEAINNSITHSNCREITLNANVSGNRISMVLEDDGEGFDPGGKNGPHRGNGLENMVSRADKIGGNLKIESFPGKGTKIMFSGRIH